MITIADVTPNSAGDAADLKHGDQIIAVNDHDSRVVELYGLRKMFQDKPGTIVHLTVKTTDGKTRHVSLKLANQI
jgi:C-terminal processing protease CtpA/Prc